MPGGIMSKTITSGSFTRLSDYEECAQRAYLKYVERIPEPDRGPPPKGKAEWPNDRGNRVHDDAERFIKGEGETLPTDLVHFSEELWRARTLYEQGLVTTEEMWAYDEDWKPIDPDDAKNTRFRIKADLTVVLDPVHKLVADFKTGKRWGNEMKHEQQKITYGIGMFLRDSELKKVSTELWYIDLPDEDVYTAVLTRSQAFVLLRALNARLKRMLTASTFPANANAYTCKWCPYNNRNGGVCKSAVV